jgi:hypothetical protein
VRGGVVPDVLWAGPTTCHFPHVLGRLFGHPVRAKSRFLRPLAASRIAIMKRASKITGIVGHPVSQYDS